MKRHVAFILIALLIPLSCAAQIADDENLNYETLLLWLNEASEIMDQAIYLAAAGSASYDPSDQYAYAQGIINLLEGPDSPLYQETSQYILRDHPGVRPFVLLLASRWGFAAVVEEHLSDAEIMQLSRAYETVDQFLRLASEAAQSAHELSGELDPASDLLRTTYALLLVARGDISDPLLLEGFSHMVDLFPRTEVWLMPGESIQDAIDLIPAYGIINLVPGTYKETLVIDKSVTLQGAIDVTGGNPIFGEAVIQGVEWKTAILISGADPLDVTIRNLTISKGAVGLHAMGEANVTAEEIHLSHCSTGAEFRENAVGTFLDSIFRANGTAFSCAGSSTCELQSCIVQDNTDAGAAVSARENATLTLEECSIVLNRGSGVHIRDDVSLTMNRCSLTRNFGYGLLAGTDICSMNTPLVKLNFDGTITGSGNTISGSGLTNGNWLGAICPEGLFQYLLESAASQNSDASTEGGEEE